NTRTAKQLLLIAGHEGSITCLALSRDGTTIASADDRGRIHLWEAASGRQRLRIEIPKGQDDRDWVGANSVAFLPDGKTLISGTYGGAIHIWEAATGKQVRMLQGGTPFALSPDGRVLANSTSTRTGVYDSEGALHLWDMRTHRELHKIAS